MFHKLIAWIGGDRQRQLEQDRLEADRALQSLIREIDRTVWQARQPISSDNL